jgi:hypothetical protein
MLLTAGADARQHVVMEKRTDHGADLDCQALHPTPLLLPPTLLVFTSLLRVYITASCDMHCSTLHSVRGLQSISLLFLHYSLPLHACVLSH